MTQGERIREVRKTLGLTLEKFGDKIGIKKNSVSQLENGINNLTEQMAKAICREYSVSEEWLRNGTGSMFAPTESFSMDEYIRQKGASDLELEIIKIYFELDPSVRKSVTEHFRKRLTGSLSNPSPLTDDAQTALYGTVPDTQDDLEKKNPPVSDEGKAG